MSPMKSTMRTYNHLSVLIELVLFSRSCHPDVARRETCRSHTLTRILAGGYRRVESGIVGWSGYGFIGQTVFNCLAGLAELVMHRGAWGFFSE
ncbi:Uncharacterised protein [Mycobacteroides abscessus subsp. abscessus]|nr:Uncharacterised protein [Mycobacteroides abscessus subsp. abscessus]